MKLKHQTEEQFLAKFREKFKNAVADEAAELATWMMDKIDDGSFADLKIRNVFGVTGAQWTALKKRLKDLQTSKKAIKSAKGE
jgi:hypothetical protein